MKNLTRHVTSATATPQKKRIPGRESEMIRNEAGGQSFSVDDWTRLERFLILGSTGGSYYVSESDLTKMNLSVLDRCVKADGPRMVEMIAKVSQEGRAPKNDPAIFALAVAAKKGNEETRTLAYRALPMVCRIGTHLFSFAQAYEANDVRGRGWGRAMKRAVSNWYNGLSADDAAYQMVKYQQREGWSQADILTLAHVKPVSEMHDGLFRYFGHWPKGIDANRPENLLQVPSIIVGFEKVKQAKTAKEVAAIIREFTLPREAVPTDWLNDSDVWDALLADMPITALIRNLGKLSSVGVLKPLSNDTSEVVRKLTDRDRIRKGRVHPMTLFAALRTYRSGHGMRGSLKWEPVKQVIEALDAAIMLSIKETEPTGKAILLAVDVSGSMSSPVSGITELSAFEGAAAMAFFTSMIEPNTHAIAFSDGGMSTRSRQHSSGLINGVLDFSKSRSVDDAISEVRKVAGGGTDCAIPIRYAEREMLAADLISIYTDEETWAGPVHVVQAMEQYRRNRRPDCKLAVCNMVAHSHSLMGDPEVQKWGLRVVGFDATVPQVISNFIKE